MVTQRDVSKRAQVSVATVSRLINNKGYISPKVRKRINLAIGVLGYKPNLVARSLKLKKTRTLGLIFPDIENPFFISLVKKAEEVAHDNNYNIILCNTENRVEKERMYIDVLMGRQIDGYIVIPSQSTNPQLYSQLKKERVVFVDRTSGMTDEICIKLDNVGAVVLAVAHLVKLGHERIGVVNVPVNVTTGSERFEGYKRGLAVHRIPIEETLIEFADFTPDAGCARTRELLGRENPPTAILPMSGPTTIGCLRAIKELDKKIPGEISVIGFDEFPYAELLNPPLTTIAQPAYRFGALATETLLKLIRGRRVKEKRVELKPELIIRASCGAPPSMLRPRSMERM